MLKPDHRFGKCGVPAVNFVNCFRVFVRFRNNLMLDGLYILWAESLGALLELAAPLPVLRVPAWMGSACFEAGGRNSAVTQVTKISSLNWNWLLTHFFFILLGVCIRVYILFYFKSCFLALSQIIWNKQDNFVKTLRKYCWVLWWDDLYEQVVSVFSCGYSSWFKKEADWLLDPWALLQVWNQNEGKCGIAVSLWKLILSTEVSARVDVSVEDGG